ncbi:MAG: SDR family oxidoreductase [Treponema sp.]|nr:SDR family oxidoreductase [Treponema sp.]
MRVCIAGVNHGLGLILAKLMAERGHKVYAGYVNKTSAEVKEAAEKFENYEPVEMDVTSENIVEKAARQIAGNGGKLDVVVVVAGILPDSDRQLLITGADINDLRAALEVNTIGSAIMIKHFSNIIKDGGMFLMITSEAGSMTNIGTKYPLYSISKAAQNKLTAIFAKTVTSYAVYAVHPGRMNTVMGRNDAQIEPEESAEEIYKIIAGEKKILPDSGWFINYRGEPMEI